MANKRELGVKRVKKQIKWVIAFVSLCVLTLILTVSGTAKTMEELVAEQEDFFLVIGASTCSYCQQYKSQTINYYSESEMGIPLLEIDWFELTEEEQTQLLETYGMEIEVTPTTYYFEAGSLKTSKEGVLTMDDLKAMRE